MLFRTRSVPTLGTILDANRGAGRGFDLLRLGLALTILVSHASAITGHSGTTAWLTSLFFGAGPAAAPVQPGALPLVPDAVGMAKMGMRGGVGLNGITGPFIRSLLPMFFALSGFLVTGSALRTQQLGRFLGLRALRIVPALLVEVVLSALILGAFFTTLRPSEYFTHPMVRDYFLNIIGVIQYHLPGVFSQNPDSVVNANLWTLPFELECYVVMSAFIIFGLLRHRAIFTTLMVVVSAILILANVAYGYNAEIAVYDGRSLIYFFACGSLFYVWRDRIYWHPALFAIAGVASYVLLRMPTGTYLAPVFITYMMAFIGVANLPQPRIVTSGDYSYGIYLYSFPVTQSIVAVAGQGRLNFLAVTALSVALTCAFAAFSWHGVEKHFMKLKRFISKPSARITETLHPSLERRPLDTAKPARAASGVEPS